MQPYQVHCPKCQALNAMQLREDFNSLEDTIACFCGAPLPTPRPNSYDYKWVPSRVVGNFALDSLTGGYRRCLEIYPVCDAEDVVLEGVVMKVYGDTEIGVRSLAAAICNWHNAEWEKAHATA